MPQDLKVALAEVESLSLFFGSLTLQQQYEFHRQVYGTMPLRTSPLWRSMVKVAQRVKQECEDEHSSAGRSAHERRSQTACR